MSEAHVDLALRLDSVGTRVRQKQRLDRVSAVLCDGLTDDPADVWRGWASVCRDAGLDVLADRLLLVADLIEQEEL